MFFCEAAISEEVKRSYLLQRRRAHLQRVRLEVFLLSVDWGPDEFQAQHSSPAD